ncbi:B-cell scaffold protein with ankyrin repeats-like isoform X3 [Neoarius graeffei]|uniref:B-cell scaffold protein with ankyrin repeats-like isoform X3 n=1 Tax=Neoarius graeffei TaxID=443677 RepID=UPI00298CDD99|nr:B-cell scaffold protein with ankyrin repeats-like isoform X3 [Neoarius graeffei]
MHQSKSEEENEGATREPVLHPRLQRLLTLETCWVYGNTQGSYGYYPPSQIIHPCDTPSPSLVPDINTKKAVCLIKHTFLSVDPSITCIYPDGKMSKTGKELLIIFEQEAEQWASYMCSILARSVSETGICCYNIAMVSSRRDNFLELNSYKCKLLILSRGLLEDMCQLYRFFLARVLKPEACVVVLLCGVESLEPLLELIPLKGEECLQISSEQDANEYRSAVLDIIRRGDQISPADMRITQKPQLSRRHSAGPVFAKSSLLVLPCHVPCENPGQVFLLLREAMARKDLEVEFSGNKQKVRVKPVNWNESTLCVTAAEFPAGNVAVTLYCGGVMKGSTHLHYYSTMGEISRLLKQAADPMSFMCQAFQSSSLEKLDHILAACVLKKMPTGGFQGLQNDQALTGVSHSEDIPTLLHFAAQYGLKDLASVLLQCPGAQQAMRSTNHFGHTPLALAHANGHSQLHILLQESLAKSNGDDTSDDTSVYELMGSTVNLRVADSRDQPHTGGARNAKVQVENDDDPYTLEGDNEEYDTILTSSSSVVMANRPPAPAPRPESLPTKEENIPYIAQVFQKKMSQGDTETFYSLPAKQTSGQDTYDTFMPGPAPGLDELIKLQEQVKKGSLSVDEALERFSDWQRVQRGLDGVQQEKLRQLRASIMNNREDDDSVYDKINIVHHTPSATTKECRRGSQQAEANFYSKPVRGQHSNFFRKADKR